MRASFFFWGGGLCRFPPLVVVNPGCPRLSPDSLDKSRWKDVSCKVPVLETESTNEPTGNMGGGLEGPQKKVAYQCRREGVVPKVGIVFCCLSLFCHMPPHISPVPYDVFGCPAGMLPPAGDVCFSVCLDLPFRRCWFLFCVRGTIATRIC